MIVGIARQVENQRAIFLEAVGEVELEEGVGLDDARLAAAVAWHEQDQGWYPVVPEQSVVEALLPQHEGTLPQDDRPQAEHQVAGREHEVMVHERMGQRHRRQTRGDSLVDAIGGERGLGTVVDAEIEHFAGVGIDLGMGREGLHRAAERFDAACVERDRIECEGRTTFPQRQQPVALHDDGGVGDVGRLAESVPQHAVRPLLAEAAVDDVAGARLVAVILGRDVAVAVVDAAIVEVDRRDHAVAVEPVGKPLAAKVVAARAVAIQRAAQTWRHLALDLVDPVVVFLDERAKAATPRIRVSLYFLVHKPAFPNNGRSLSHLHAQIVGTIEAAKAFRSAALAPSRARMAMAYRMAPAICARAAGEGFLGRSLAAKARSRLFSIAARSSLATAAIFGWLGDSTAAVPTIMQPGRCGGAV